MQEVAWKDPVDKFFIHKHWFLRANLAYLNFITQTLKQQLVHPSKLEWNCSPNVSQLRPSKFFKKCKI
jgi:hypothetical protein